jgi:hypothetical protein
MSYGWMLLVVAVIGGAIFSLVGDQTIENVTGFTGSNIAVEDFGVTGDNELAFKLRNTDSSEVTIKSIVLKDPDTGARTKVYSSKSIGVGSSKTLKINGFETISSTNNQKLKVVFSSGNLDNITDTGSITAQLVARNHVFLEEADFNRSSNVLEITATNTGSENATSVDYSINSDSNSITGNVGEVSTGETTSFTATTDQTFDLKNTTLDVEGDEFSDSNRKIKCLPTDRLGGYWSFDREHINGGEAEDLSGNGNHGDMNGGLSSDDLTDGKRSEALKFDGNNDIVETNLSIDQSSSTDGVTMAAWVYPREGTDARRHVFPATTEAMTGP